MTFWSRSAAGYRSPQMLGIFLLSIVTAYQLIVLAVWLKMDLRPPRHDESVLLAMSVHSFDHLRSGDIIGALRTFQIANTKTGLVSFLAALSYFPFGIRPGVATFLINGFSIVAIAVSMGALARRLFEDALVGAAAFSLLLISHMLAAWSHFFILDLPLTALVCLTLAAMLEVHANRFKFSPWLVVLAFALMTGIPTKHLFVGFVAAPLAFLFLDYVLRDAEPLELRLRRAAFVGGVSLFASLIGLSYHILNWPVVQEMLLRSTNSALTGGAGEPPSLGLLVNQLNQDMFYGYGAYALIPGFLALIFRRRFALVFLLVWIGSGIALVVKSASYPLLYYFLPIYPALALIAFAWLGRGILSTRIFWPTRVALVISTLLGAVGLTYINLGTTNPLLVIAEAPSIMGTSFSNSPNPFVSFDSTKQIALGRLPHASKIYPRPSLDDLTMQFVLFDGNEHILPYPFDWQMDRIVHAIKVSLRGRPKRSQRLAVAIMSEAEYFSSNLLEFELRKHGISGVITNKRNTPLWSRKFDADLAFLITKTGPIYKALTTNEDQQFAEHALANDGAVVRNEGFTPLLTLALPDGSIGTLWQHKERLRNT